MQEIDSPQDRALAGSAESDQAEDRIGDSERPIPSGRYRLLSPKYILVYLLLLVVLLLAILPPLLNVNRFKRRIVASISASLGRPVHLDTVSLVLLPFPGFKIENFVVSEDPAFGAEPVIHANNVQATLRVSSLWRRRVEFSTISLQEPSINLVHTSQGKWNFESILLQASRIPAAPTGQLKSGADPRFPYIEAMDARLNIKFGDEKLPFSLTEADFALWLPDPGQWRLRLQAKPTRTDSSASDTGKISLEGSLGRAERFDLIPIDVSGEWKNAPLGEASRVVTGRDAGIRGELKINVSARGTVGASVVDAALELKGARRAEFVPPRPLDLRVECQANSTGTFHAFHQLRCSWPPSEPSLLNLTGDLPDVYNLDSASFDVAAPRLPASSLVDWLRIASARVPADVTATGTISGKMTHVPGSPISLDGLWRGQFVWKDAGLAGGDIGEVPIVLGDLSVASGQPETPVATSSHKNRRERHRAQAPKPFVDREFVMSPAKISLGGKEPALLGGSFDRNGYSLHLSGGVLASRLSALGTAIPQFGDGLVEALAIQPATKGKENPVIIDLTSERNWGGAQSWMKTPSSTPGRTTRSKRRQPN